MANDWEMLLHLGSSNLEAPSVLGQYMLQITGNWTNTHPTDTIVPALYVVVISEGTFTVINGSCMHMIGVLSKQDVLSAESSPMVDYRAVQHVFGGDFWSSLKEGVSKFYNKVLKPAAPYILKGAEAIAKYGPLLAAGEPNMMMGMGRRRHRRRSHRRRGGEVLGGDYVGGRRRHRRHRRRGGDLLGGALIDRDEIGSRLESGQLEGGAFKDQDSQSGSESDEGEYEQYQE